MSLRQRGSSIDDSWCSRVFHLFVSSEPAANSTETRRLTCNECVLVVVARRGYRIVVRRAEVRVLKIKIDTSAPRRSKWYEYLIRFVFGGAVTAIAGIIANFFGPEIGGLFLAFPAILPATATLIGKQQKQKKEQHGEPGTLRAREIAGVDAAGAAMGSMGLLVFAIIVWIWIKYSVVTTLCVATFAWFLTAVLTWKAHDTIGRRIRAKLSKGNRSFLGNRN